MIRLVYRQLRQTMGVFCIHGDQDVVTPVAAIRQLTASEPGWQLPVLPGADHHPLGVLERSIVAGGVPLGSVMPGFKGKVSKDDARVAIAYFQSFWSDDTYTLAED
jgi:hypothetical protein